MLRCAVAVAAICLFGLPAAAEPSAGLAAPGDCAQPDASFESPPLYLQSAEVGGSAADHFVPRVATDALGPLVPGVVTPTADRLSATVDGAAGTVADTVDVAADAAGATVEGLGDALGGVGGAAGDAIGAPALGDVGGTAGGALGSDGLAGDALGTTQGAVDALTGTATGTVNGVLGGIQ